MKHVDVNEATYQGREVPLNKPMAGDVKKSKVFVDPDGDGVAKKVNFGDKNMTIKKHIKDRKKSFNARHNCDNPGPKDKPRYWSCKAWEDVMADKVSEIVSELIEKNLSDACWKGYEAIGTKKKDGKEVPNCVPVKEDVSTSAADKEAVTYTKPDGTRATKWVKRSRKDIVKEAVAEASLFLEEFETQQAASSAMDRHLKKFPSSKLSITRGTSGKYHVMKHTSGGSSRLH